MQQNGHRVRFTRAIVRTLPVEALAEAYIRSHLYKYLVDQGHVTPTPIEAAKAKRQHAVLRAELIKRGFERENLDADPPIPASLQAEIDEMKALKSVADTTEYTPSVTTRLLTGDVQPKKVVLTDGD